MVGDDFEPTLPPYRENPTIVASDEAAGRVTHTEQGRTARVDKSARDLAKADQTEVESRTPGPSWEQLSVMGANIADEAGVRSAGRADALRVLDTTQRTVTDREADATEADQGVDEATTDVPRRPWSGTGLTRWWVLLVPLPVLVVLEEMFSQSSLLVALPSASDTTTAIAAAGIAIVLTLAAELIAVVLGTRLARLQRRGAAITSAIVAISLAALIAWTVVSMAASREPNIAYQQSLTARSAPGTPGSFSAPAATAAAGGAAANAPGSFGSSASGPSGSGVATPAATKAPNGPRLDFVVPVTLVALLVGLVLSLRCGIARPWKEAQERLRLAIARRDAARAALSAARTEYERAIATLDRIDLEFGALVQREVATTNRLLDRLQAEYEFACAAGGRTGGLLPRPALPTPEALIAQAFDPPRASPRRVASTDPLNRPPIVDPLASEPADPVVAPEATETPNRVPPTAAPPHPDANPPGSEDLWAATPGTTPTPDDRPTGWWSGPVLDIGAFPEPWDGHIPTNGNGS